MLHIYGHAIVLFQSCVAPALILSHMVAVPVRARTRGDTHFTKQHSLTSSESDPIPDPGRWQLASMTGMVRILVDCPVTVMSGLQESHMPSMLLHSDTSVKKHQQATSDRLVLTRHGVQQPHRRKLLQEGSLTPDI
ncbi:hypothetical protein EDD22DRAFT_905705 [Suillus occidentalis]|nr:hypothetical protein EDD22DRAFT_905705 [Suillus occidentalis]